MSIDEMIARGNYRWKDVQRELMVQALNRHNWNKTHAAIAMGLSLRAFRYKLKRFNIQRPKMQEASDL